MKLNKYRDYLNYLDEEVTTGDIAPIDSRLGDQPAKIKKRKKCKKHDLLNCDICHKSK